MSTTGETALVASAGRGGVPPPPAVWTAAILAALTGTAAILAAHECAFTYPSGSSTLTSAATTESPSPISIGS